MNYDEAIPWLERALQSRRYESYHYPHYNLGRAYMAKEMYVKARYHFEQALKLSSDYTLAKEALEKVRRKLHSSRNQPIRKLRPVHGLHALRTLGV